MWFFSGSHRTFRATFALARPVFMDAGIEFPTGGVQQMRPV